MLKSKYATQDEIPEGLVEHYIERDGAWELQAEGMKTTEDVERVKRDLVKERNEHKATKDKYRPIATMLDGDKITIETIVERLDNYEALETAANSAPDAKSIEDKVQARLDVEEKKWKREREALVKERDDLRGEATKLSITLTADRIQTQLTQACVEAGVDKKSMEDVLMYAGKFTLNDEGKAQTQDGLTVKLWLEDQKDRKNWWGPSQGAGASGSDAGSGGENPWKGNNLTEMALYRKTHGDEKAKQMAQRAGKDLLGTPLPK